MSACCREGPILIPCWKLLFWLAFVAVVIIIKHNSLPQRILPLCLTVKLKRFVHLIEIIWHCPPVFLFLFSHSVLYDSMNPGLQHARLPCSSPSPRACSNSCSLSRWCHPTISSSVIPFSSHLQPFPASGSFPMSQFFTPGGQSIGASYSASVCPMNSQD